MVVVKSLKPGKLEKENSFNPDVEEMKTGEHSRLKSRERNHVQKLLLLGETDYCRGN